MFDNARPQDIIAFLQRIDSTVLSGRSPRDAWVEYLKKNGGGTGSLNDLEKNWLNTLGSSTGEKTHDKLQSRMSAKGFSGSLTDKVHAYLTGSATA